MIRQALEIDYCRYDNTDFICILLPFYARSFNPELHAPYTEDSNRYHDTLHEQLTRLSIEAESFWLSTYIHPSRKRKLQYNHYCLKYNRCSVVFFIRLDSPVTRCEIEKVIQDTHMIVESLSEEVL